MESETEVKLPDGLEADDKKARQEAARLLNSSMAVADCSRDTIWEQTVTPVVIRKMRLEVENKVLTQRLLDAQHAAVMYRNLVQNCGTQVNRAEAPLPQKAAKVKKRAAEKRTGSKKPAKSEGHENRR